MGNDDVRLYMTGLQAISNIANEKICEPMAEKIVAGLGGGYRIDVTPRTDIPGWGRTRIWTDSEKAYRDEYVNGALAKALG